MLRFYEYYLSCSLVFCLLPIVAFKWHSSYFVTGRSQFLNFCPQTGHLRWVVSCFSCLFRQVLEYIRSLQDIVYVLSRALFSDHRIIRRCIFSDTDRALYKYKTMCVCVCVCVCVCIYNATCWRVRVQVVMKTQQCSPLYCWPSCCCQKHRTLHCCHENAYLLSAYNAVELQIISSCCQQYKRIDIFVRF